MSRRTQPLFLRVSIGLGLATAAFTATARADPGMLTHLGIGVTHDPEARARPPRPLPGPPGPVPWPLAGGEAPAKSPQATAQQIGTPVAEVKHVAGAVEARPEDEDLPAIFAAVTAERSSWSKVQQLLRQQPAIADTPIYHEIAQFQQTVPTVSALAATAAKPPAGKDADPLAGQTRRQRQELLQNLTTQNVVLQTLLAQVSARHLDGWRVAGQHSARWPGQSTSTPARHRPA